MLPTFRAPHRVLLIALLLGIMADWLFVGRWIGISALLFVAAGLLALWYFSATEQRPPTAANTWVGGATLLFAALLAVRDAPVLVLLNTIAVLGLLLIQAASYRSVALTRLSSFETVLRLLLAGCTTAVAPALLIGQSLHTLPVRQARLGAALPVIRGLLLAIPALLFFGGLLMSADGVFASYVAQAFSLRFPFDLGSMVNHSVVALIVAWICAGGIAVALHAAAPVADSDLPAEGDTQRLDTQRTPWRVLGWVEALTVLIVLDLLFSAFMLVQGAYFFGGLDTLARSAMTFSAYARRGFFELVVVACLALALLWAMALLTRRDHRRHVRWFNAASVLMVLLVLGMLISAFQRMWLYEAAYGFTQLRIYTHSFMIWLAVVLALFVAALLRQRMSRFVFGSFVSALVYLVALNIANPDALIVRANVARYADVGKLDADYLSSLSADATPELVAALDRIDTGARATLQDALTAQGQRLAEAAAEQGWPAWNLARAQAAIALYAPGEATAKHDRPSRFDQGQGKVVRHHKNHPQNAQLPQISQAQSVKSVEAAHLFGTLPWLWAQDLAAKGSV